MKNIDAVVQAVSRDDYKKSVHILPEDIDDDDLFDLYLQGAQEVVEAATRRPMTQRSVEFQCRATGWRRWWFPVTPVDSVTAIAWQNEAGAWIDLGVTGIRIEQSLDEPQLIVPASFFETVTDGAAIRITALVGHQVADRPRQLAQAVIMIVKDWFEAGIAIEKKEFLDVSFGCRALIKQVRYARPAEYAAS